MQPNFIIAGGVATGTSFLSATLANHPDIYLPKIQRPEPNFFHYSWKYNKGIGWYKQTWFNEVGDQRAIGERSSLLLPSDVAAKRIYDFNPRIKLIFCLRNPIERAWANYRFSVLEGLEPLPFNEAIESESERMKMAQGKWAEVQPHAYVTRSRYSKHLKEFIDIFGRDNVLMIKSEELGLFPNEHIKLVCDFLGVDSNVQLPLPPNYSSPSVIDRSLQVELRSYFGDRFPEIVESIRKEEEIQLNTFSVDDVKNIDRLRSNLMSRKDPIPDFMRKRLQELFNDEIEQMKNLVDFKIDDWL